MLDSLIMKSVSYKIAQLHSRLVVDHFYSQLCEPRAVTVDGNIGNGEHGPVSPLSLSARAQDNWDAERERE